MANEINLVHKRQFFKNTAQGGGVASGAIATFYVQGSSSSKQDTYSDEGLTTPNLNSLTADSNGRFGAVYGGQMPYHVIITDAAGNTLVDDDGVMRNKTRIKATALPSVHWADMEVYNSTDGHLYERAHDDLSWIDRGPIDGAGNLSTVSEVIALTNATHTVTPATLFGLMGLGAGITAASSVTLDSGGGKLFVVSGSTTTINTINTSTDAREILLFFSTAQNLGHGSGINTPTGASLYCPANSFARLIRYNSIWYVLAQYQMGNNIGPVGVGSVQNLTLTNDVTTPNTKGVITCDGAVLVDANNRTLVSGAQSLTVNLGTVGANGIDAGVQAVSTWYHFWIIGKADGTIAGLASTSATAPTMPTGYTFKVRVGAMRSGAATTLLRTLQKGRRARYVVAAGSNTTLLPQMVAPTNSQTHTAIATGAFVPTTAVEIMVVAAQQGGANKWVTVAPNADAGYVTTIDGTTGPSPISTFGGAGASVESGNSTANLLLESTNIYYSSGSAASGATSVNAYGWTDAVNA